MTASHESARRRLKRNSSSGSNEARASGARLTQRDLHEASKKAEQSLQHFLLGLPIVSVGQKHEAHFECDLPDQNSSNNNNNAALKLVWVKLVRHQTNESDASNDITLLSLNKRLITPDRRFRISHQAPRTWILTLDQVNQVDDGAYFLCQAAGDQSSQATRGAHQAHIGPNSSGFIGGAKLNVLVPPKLVENETSPNLLTVDEFSAVKLTCKVRSEPSQSQITWRREDGLPLDGLEQRFKHQIKRFGGAQNNELVASIDSSELLIEHISRQQAGAYLVSSTNAQAAFPRPNFRPRPLELTWQHSIDGFQLVCPTQCIASNGVQPGVSQRILIVVQSCRQSEAPASKREQCRDEQPQARANSELGQQPARSNTGDEAPDQQRQQQQPAQKAMRNGSWKQATPVASKQLAPNRRTSANANATDKRQLGGVISDDERRGRRPSVRRRPPQNAANGVQVEPPPDGNGDLASSSAAPSVQLSMIGLCCWSAMCLRAAGMPLLIVKRPRV